MKTSVYDALIARLERQALASPGWYRWRVGILAGFGYAVVVLALLLGLAVLAAGILGNWWAMAHHHVNTGLVKIGIVMVIIGGGIAWAVLRGVLVRIPPPDGVTLTRRQAPDLFDEVDRLRASMGAPPVHRIVIDGHFNASLAQRPLLGLFGWYRNHLVLGLPLLRQLSVAQARSVIAHELGHLHGQDGRFGTWIYRLRSTWSRIAEHTGGWRITRWFLDWYGPLFNAYSFVLARQQERHADRLAADASSAEAAATALARAVIAERQGSRFWNELFLRAGREPQPPANLLNEFDRTLSQADARTRRWIDEALHRSNDRNDPHPCLRERLEGLGCAHLASSPMAMTPVPYAQSAARHWLRDQEADLARTFDANWITTFSPQWQAHHEQAKIWRQERQDLLAKRDAGGITTDERWSLAVASMNLDGMPAARDAVEEVLKAKPDHPQALFVLGRHLLEEGDARGIPLLQAAMRHDDSATLAVSELLSDFADTHGETDLKRQAEEHGEAHAEVLARAAEERNRLPKARQLRPHGVDEAALARIRQVLAGHPEIAGADLARVEVQHLPEKPYFILVIIIRVAWWRFRSETANQALVSTVVNELTGTGLVGTWLVINGVGNTAGTAKAVRKQDHARIHVRTP